MAATTQSELERIGIIRRQLEMVRVGYPGQYRFSNRDRYEAGHDMAMSHDDPNSKWGKGTRDYDVFSLRDYMKTYRFDGRSEYVPQIDTFDGGNGIDKTMRNDLIYGYNLYNPTERYGKESVDIDLTIDGQWFFNA